MFFIDFSISSYPIRSHAIIIGYTKPYVKPIKFITKLYANNNTSLVKHVTYWKAASLSKLDNTVNSSSIFNTKFLHNSWCSFLFTTLIVHTTTLQSPSKILCPTFAIFHFPIPPLLIHKIIFKIFTILGPLPPYLCIQPSLQSTSRVFFLPRSLR